ncbi:MAG: hypothetical protein WCV85_01910 [Patescibacteria group bacterium]|jgi:hypothetical protein
MDIHNIRFAPGSTKIVTGKTLNTSGCPFCNHKGSSDSTRAFLKEELPEELQTCGNVYIHVCLSCHLRSIAVQHLPTTYQREKLRALVAEHYGGVADERLMFVTMLRSTSK